MSNNSKPVFGEKVTTPAGRLGFNHLESPDSGGQYSDDKFKCDVIFEEGTKLTVLKKKALDCAKEKWGDDICLDDLYFPPLKDGNLQYKEDEDTGEKTHYDGYKGAAYLSAKSKNRPGIVDGSRNPFPANETYSGIEVKVNITPMAFEIKEKGREPKKGITWLLNGVQVGRQLDRFGVGVRSAAETFTDWEPEDEVTAVVDKTDSKTKKKGSDLSADL